MSRSLSKGGFEPVVKLMYRLYVSIYNFLCGNHPYVKPWHFQWHALRELNRDLGETLPALTGEVLDLGCGMKPYRALLTSADGYTGADIEGAPDVDSIIIPGAPLPFEDNSFDAVISTQVLEHVADLDFTLSEIRRVLKSGGTFVASAPFVYQVHGAPHDYRRFSEFGLEHALTGFSIESMRRQGAIGSTMAIMLLCWINSQLGTNVMTWGIKALMLPVWIPFSLLVNLFSLLLDCLDTTKSSYHNLLVVARLS